MGRLFADDGAGLLAHYQSPGEIADRIGVVFDAWRRHQIDAFLPRQEASESFSAERVLSELAGACLRARHAHAREGSVVASSTPIAAADGMSRDRLELTR
jgi:hypothetical protein